jgi:hypothetical protein
VHLEVAHVTLEVSAPQVGHRCFKGLFFYSFFVVVYCDAKIRMGGVIAERKRIS